MMFRLEATCADSAIMDDTLASLFPKGYKVLLFFAEDCLL